MQAIRGSVIKRTMLACNSRKGVKMSAMHVMICSEYFGPDTGATGKVLHGIAESLLMQDEPLRISVITTDRSHRTTAAQRNEQATASDRLHVTRLQTLALDRNKAAQRFIVDVAFAMSVMVRLVFARRTPDVVLVVTNPFVLPGAVAAYSLVRGVPFVYLVHDLYPDILVALGAMAERSPATRLFRTLQGSWFRNATAIIVLGRCMRDRLQATYGVKADKVAVIENWSEIDKIVPAPRNTQFRRNHRLDGFLVLYSGNIGRFHDIDTVLDAAALIRDTDPSVTFVFAGAGGGRPHVEARVAGEGLTNVRVLELVPESELSDLLASADAILVTLAGGTEGMAVPLKFYNALAAGRPMIAVMDPTSEVARTIDELDCGMHSGNGDAEGLARAIATLANQPVAAAAMGHRARLAADHQFTLERTATGFSRVLAKAAKHHGDPVASDKSG